MTIDGFVHFGARSDFSVGYAIARPDQLARAAAHDAQPAIALTDRNSLAGAPAFAATCRHLGMRTHFGIELSVRPWGGGTRPSRVRLIASTAVGWKRLIHLLHIADKTEPEDGSVTWDDILTAPQGLVIITGGPVSELLDAEKDDCIDSIEKLVGRQLDAFAAENLRIALHAPSTEKNMAEVR